MSEAVIKEQEWRPGRGPWLIAMPTMFAAFMFVLDETIANVALPHMAGTFSASREESLWILTSYLVASGIIIPAVDWFCKLLGRKNFFIFSAILFTVASVLCGVSKSLDMMIVARVLQGFGGGGLLPVSQAILLEAFPKNMRGKAMAMFGLVVVVAPIIGPVIGGWITDNWNWPWVFLINLPIGIFTIFLANEFLEDPPYAQKQKNVKIDGKGFLFLTLWIVSLQIILDKGNNADWFHSAWVWQLTIVMVVCAVLFFWSQAVNKDSLVDLSIFKDRNYFAGTLMQVVIQGVLLASLAILPQFLQSLMGYNAYLSGLSMMPRGIGALFAMTIYAALSNKVDNRILAGIGLCLIGGAGLSLGNLNLHISSMNIAIPNFVFGFGMGLAMIPLIELSVSTLKNTQMTNAAGMQNLLKNISGAVGTSIAATIISRFSQIHQANLVENLNVLNPVFQAKLSALTGALAQYTHPVSANYMAQYVLYGELLKQSTLWGFIESFRILAVASFAVIPFLFLLKKIKSN